jgi:predicted ester cyclase
VRRYYEEMWNKWDFALTDKILTEDIRFRGSLGAEMRGRGEFRNYVLQVQSAFPDFHNRIDELVVEADRAVARLTYTGTQRGKLFGLAPTESKSATMARLSIASRTAGLPKDGYSVTWSDSCVSWAPGICRTKAASWRIEAGAWAGTFQIE